MAGCGDDVAAWLDKLGLAEYTDKFLSSGYSSLKQCVVLSKEDLSAIGVVKVGHINRLFRDLERMKVDGEIEMSPSPPSSSPGSPIPPSGLPIPPPIVKPVIPPAVPPRRILPHKPKSDGNINNSPPPKLLPRKGSLRKTASANVIKSFNNNMDAVDREQIRIPSSQSLNDILHENQSLELKNEVTATVSRLPPPVAPRKD